eukprot:scaffold5138_cov251-Pinguiococcus_pyrenoidosus.AAC.9
MRSAAFKPMMCTPRIFSVSLLKSTFAMPSPSSSARAFELARKWPTDLPSSKPSALARSTACSSVRPTKAMFGCVKQAAGIASWSTTCSCPTMFSTALIPWAEAACASIILPLASPMHQRPSTTSPSGPVSTCIFSFTCTNPRTAKVLRVRLAASGDHAGIHLERLDVLLCLGVDHFDGHGLHSGDGRRDLGGEDAGAIVNGPALDQEALRQLRDLAIEGRHDVVEGLDEGDLRSQGRVDVAELQADVAAADNRDPLGHALEVEATVAGEDGLLVHFDARRHERQGAGGQDHILGGDGLAGPLQLDGARSGHLRAVGKDLDAEALEAVLQIGSHLVRQVARVRSNGRPVELHVAKADPQGLEVLLVLQLAHAAAGRQQRLAGHAAAIHTGSAHIPTGRHCHLCGATGGLVSASLRRISIDASPWPVPSVPCYVRARQRRGRPRRSPR